MSYWHDWARSVAQTSVEQENESEIKQSIEQTQAQINEGATNAVFIGDDNEFDDDFTVLALNVNDQEQEQEADNDADVEQANFGAAAAVEGGIEVEERGPGDVFG